MRRRLLLHLLAFCLLLVVIAAAAAPPLPGTARQSLSAAWKACLGKTDGPPTADLPPLLRRAESSVPDWELVECMVGKGIWPFEKRLEARLVTLAARKKSLKVVAQRIAAAIKETRPLPLDYRCPETGFSALHEALINPLNSFDALRNLLPERAKAAAEHQCKALGQEAKKILRFVAGMLKHLPQQAQTDLLSAVFNLFSLPDAAERMTAEEQLRLRAFLTSIAAESAAAKVPSWFDNCGRTVHSKGFQTISNALSYLLTRLLVDAVITNAALDPSLAEQSWQLLTGVDNFSRSLLHIAALTDNSLAMREILQGAFRLGNSGEDTKLSNEMVLTLRKWISQRDSTGASAADIASDLGHSEVQEALGFYLALLAGHLEGSGDDDEAPFVRAARLLEPTVVSSVAVTPAEHSVEASVWSSSESALIAASPLAQKAISRAQTRSSSVAFSCSCDAAVGSVIIKDADSGSAALNEAEAEAEAAAFDCGMKTGRGPITMTPQQFIERHVVGGKPAILKRHGWDWRLRKEVLTLDSLLSRYGSMSFRIGRVPYARSFGLAGDGDALNSTLSDYIRSTLRIGAEDNKRPDASRLEDDKAPLYIFDPPGQEKAALTAAEAKADGSVEVQVSMPRWVTDPLARELLQHFEPVPPFLRGTVKRVRTTNNGTTMTEEIPLVPSLEEILALHQPRGTADLPSPLTRMLKPHKPQFYLGPPGSGAPMHHHKSAWNFLAYGQKRWFLIPPGKHSLYSTQPIAEWVLALPEDRGESEGLGIIECTQEAGDVIFVPSDWSHGVLNTKTSIGVALEFSTVLDLQ